MWKPGNTGNLDDLRRLPLWICVLVVFPHVAYAQASITGVVKDTSGAVLPGVTVEASSPALIEKTRTVVTDGTGQYRIEILPSGTYSVTFSLPGFNPLRREGIELSGTFTASVDAALGVGALEETVTVSGESPLIDVQSVSRQRVIDRELIDALPGGRSPLTMAALFPAITVGTAGQDVGGTTLGLTGVINLSVHGARGQAQLLMENGLPTNAFNVPSTSRLTFNMAAAQEVTYEYGGTSAEQNGGGVSMNVIPREGGNRFNGTLVLNGTNSSLQGNNFSQELKDAGLLTPDAVRSQIDINPGFGGPLKRDRLWFYASGRYANTARFVGGEFLDKNFNNPNAWTYEPDLSQPATTESTVTDGRVRLTWQAAPKIKVGGMWVEQNALDFPSGVGYNRGSTVGANPGIRITAYEATSRTNYPIERQRTVDVTAPWTGRLLFDGALMQKIQVSTSSRVPGQRPDMIQVLEQSTNRTYRGRPGADSRTGTYKYSYRAAISYVTGAHAFKVGLTDSFGHLSSRDDGSEQGSVTYRFNNGIPNQITMRAPISSTQTNIDRTFGAYAQDRWTHDQLTLNVGLRFDWFKNSFPQQVAGPAILAPTRNIVLPALSNLSWMDLDPKLGLAYDLFGDGKTALKGTLNRYVQGYTVNGIAGARNPVDTLITSTTRTWNDANRNFVPDCDLMVLGVNGECGPAASNAFGSTRPGASFDPETLTGWGKRDYNWEFTGSVEREVISNVTADLSYLRRWFGNTLVTDNLAVEPSDYTRFDLTVPVDPRLPGGGGYVVHGVHDLIPSKVGATDLYTTFANRYGKLTQRYDSIALNVAARLPGRLQVRGGIDLGKQTNDDCEIAAKLPETLFGGLALSGSANAGVWQPLEFCHQATPWQKQMRLFGTYTVPRIDVQTSATFSAGPTDLVLANYAVPASVVRPLIGRDPTAGANVPVELIEPGSVYGPYKKQLDLRVSKILRFGRTKITASADLDNALNDNTPLLTNSVYTATSWRQPLSIMMARLVSLGLQLDF